MKQSCRRYTNKKELNEVIVDLISEGWTVRDAGPKKHLYDPLGHYRLCFHRSPSDGRFLRNALASVRRAKRAYEEDLCGC